MKRLIYQLVPLALLIAWLPTSAAAEEPVTIVEVVANGAGVTKKTALEDAYRNAVQQVVGIYVDAETVVKNDELLRDKILATSNGFIVDSKEIFSRASNGLIRVTIRAKVESKKLVAGLNAAKITTREFDGESLFAKALTKMERKENLQETLLKILVELGPMLQVDMIGEPDFDAATKELVFQLKVQPDYEKFKLFRKRLGSFLDKVCIRKMEIGILAKKGSIKLQDVPSELTAELYVSDKSQDLLWGPALKTNKHWVLWLQTFENKSFTSLRWTGYVLDTDWRPVMMTVMREMISTSQSYSRKQDTPYHFNFTLASGRVRHPELGRTFVSTKFLDADKELVQFDKFELFTDAYGYDGWSPSAESLLLPALVNYCPRDTGDPVYYGYNSLVPRSGMRRGDDWNYKEGTSLNLIIAPAMLGLAWEDEFNGPYMVFRRFIKVERRLKVRPDELRAIRKTEHKIDYIKPNLPPMPGK